MVRFEHTIAATNSKMVKNFKDIFEAHFAHNPLNPGFEDIIAKVMEEVDKVSLSSNRSVPRAWSLQY